MNLKKILLSICILGLVAGTGLAGQPPGDGTKKADEQRYYKSFRIEHVKGSIEERACPMLSPDIGISKTLSIIGTFCYLSSLLHVEPPFDLYARPPPR